MQSDKFDKKVKEAAEHHHPSYDEKAWENMEKLLNKHLPQKEDDRRRYLFILLLFLLLGGGAWLMIAKPWKGDEQVAKNEQRSINNSSKEKDQAPQQGTAPGTDGASKSEQQTGGDTQVAGDGINKDKATSTSNSVVTLPAASGKTTVSPKTLTTNPTPVNGQVNNTDKNDTRADFVANTIAGAKSKKRTTAPKPAEADNNRKDVTSIVKTKDEPVKDNAVDKIAVTNKSDNKQDDRKKPVSTDPVVTNPNPVADVKVDAKKDEPVAVVKAADQKNTEVKNDVAAKNTDDKKETAPVASGKKNEKKNSSSKKSNSFFFSLSTGPDVSFVGSNSAGKLKIVTGVGIGYTIKDKFTIRTGFYTARKIYTAKPSDYKAPPEFYQFYPYLEKVDANCRVYEIPLALSYNFGKNANWFVSAGLSSFLMNEESYNYFYKYTPTGNTYTNRWTIKNENAHFFSVGTLSAGYKRNVSKRVSIMAEPYIKVPFGGVGYGKVKLNSGGVLFTVGIKAF